jgi:DNA-binding GntR family transcriptional regulator
VAGEIGAEYRRLMDLILSRIASGEYPTGSQIPSTAQWEADGWSRDTTRTAISRLQGDGILQGQAGKGVFVKATPEQVARERLDLEGLHREYREIRRAMGRIEASLIDLYGKLGYEYPRDDDGDGAEAPVRHERA